MSHSQEKGGEEVVDPYESDASTIDKFEVGGNAIHPEFNSAVAQGMRSRHTSSLFSCDMDDTDSVAKARRQSQLSLRLPLGRVLRADR